MSSLLNSQIQKKVESLTKELNEARRSYYNGVAIMSDFEYDKKLEELDKLEKFLGIHDNNSPVDSVGSEPTGSSKRVKHKFPAKSLDKTKNVDEFIKTFVNENTTDGSVAMWKLDGSTIQLTYSNGYLELAATRGDGVVGVDITEQAAHILNIPTKLNEKVDIVVRGEAVITYSDFKIINETLESDGYKNPRNLASATITMLDFDEIDKRKVRFKAFELVDYKNKEWDVLSFEHRLDYLESLGFDVVEHTYINKDYDEFKKVLNNFEERSQTYDIPVDGIVVAYNSTQVSEKLEGTAHHPNPLYSYALKWKDETVKTTIREIEWSPSRTGLLNPVAIFDSVELEGTTVSRASIHNLSIMASLHIRVGDEVSVYKANKIIPQIGENFDSRGEYSYEEMNPKVKCSACGKEASVFVSTQGVRTLMCTNPSCPCKHLKALAHFVSKSGMYIDGLSEKTLLDLVSCGLVSTFSDIYHLKEHKDVIISLEGWGETSFNNLVESIEASRKQTLPHVISSLGIPSIGYEQSKLIAENFDTFYDFIFSLNYNYADIKGIGPKLSKNLKEYLSDINNIVEMKKINEEIVIVKDENSDKLSGLNFVITGKLNTYKSRDELVSIIEKNGGKVLSSISKKTNYLINNDVTSTSSKNKKAHELNIPIISEDEFNNMI